MGLQGYKEGELTFPPTFKFDPGTDVYDSSAKSRIPSWCDRVLWRCNSDAYDTVELLQYTHVPQLKVSDHRYVTRPSSCKHPQCRSTGCISLPTFAFVQWRDAITRQADPAVKCMHARHG